MSNQTPLMVPDDVYQGLSRVRSEKVPVQDIPERYVLLLDGDHEGANPPNMLDLKRVQIHAFCLNEYAAVNWLEDRANRSKAIQGVLRGFVPESIGQGGYQLLTVLLQKMPAEQLNLRFDQLVDEVTLIRDEVGDKGCRIVADLMADMDGQADLDELVDAARAVAV